MNHIEILFPRPWQIRRPVVTRYMDTQYVDDFFRDGSLRLSSFRRFRQYDDEVRGDGFEGRASQTWTHPDGGTSAIVTTNGGRCFVLCGASSEGPEIAKAFGHDDGFRILDTVAFADAISRHIPGFVRGVEGLCMYREDVGLTKAMPQMFIKEDELNPEAFAERFDKAVAKGSIDSFFLKRLRYATQCEYRLIWIAAGDEIDYIDVKCPEARAFTERLPKFGTSLANVVPPPPCP